MSESRERTLAVQPGDATDTCPLCGIHRQNAGFLRESCGDGYLKPGCFVVQTEDPNSHDSSEEPS